MLSPVDKYFQKQAEPVKSCLEFLRSHILNTDADISESWKYGMPFYCYDGKMFCYLWVDKKFKQPYLGVVEGNKIDHPELLKEKRSRMKILLIDPDKNIPIKKINGILKEVLKLYKK
jgi:uncharacterized protein DUF1801